MENSKINWEKLSHQPAAILGDGVSGRGLKKLLQRLEWNSRIFDEKGIPLTASKLSEASVVLVSPGFSPNHPWMQMVHSSQIPFYGEMDFASSFLMAKPLGVTGTNGKTTLSYLIGHIMSQLGEQNVLLGNMGNSLSQYLGSCSNQRDKVILEISSFQARNLKILKPSCSFWTNFEDDHLDYHQNRRDYFLSKMRLIERTSGPCFAGESVKFAARKLGIKYPDNIRFIERPGTAKFPLPANHFLSSFPQRENYSLAEAYFKSRGVSEKKIAEMAISFVPQPYRLTPVTKINNTLFWNDSKSTNLSSTIAAFRSMGGKTTWIGGGKSKGNRITEFAKEIKDYLDEAFVIGEVSDELSISLAEKGVPVSRCKSLPEAVEGAYRSGRPKNNILFSPGFSSFDQFQNYEERGKIFNQAVFDLKKKVRVSTHSSTT